MICFQKIPKNYLMAIQVRITEIRDSAGMLLGKFLINLAFILARFFPCCSLRNSLFFLKSSTVTVKQKLVNIKFYTTSSLIKMILLKKAWRFISLWQKTKFRNKVQRQQFGHCPGNYRKFKTSFYIVVFPVDWISFYIKFGSQKNY